MDKNNIMGICLLLIGLIIALLTTILKSVIDVTTQVSTYTQYAQYDAFIFLGIALVVIGVILLVYNPSIRTLIDIKNNRIESYRDEITHCETMINKLELQVNELSKKIKTL